MRLWLAVGALVVAGAIIVVVLTTAGASDDSWSAPVALATCGAAAQPKVVFPFSAPNVRSGEGAIVWLGAAPPCNADAPATTLDIAPLAGDDQPGLPRSLLGGAAAAASLTGPLHVAGTSVGEIVAVAGSPATRALGRAEALAGDGFARGRIDTLLPLGGPDDDVATMNGFIGDLDVATVTRAPGGGQEILVRAQRHFDTTLRGHRALRLGGGSIRALTLGMDFRADRLAVWAQDGEVWAQYIDNRGRIKARQALGPSGYDPQIATVLSDDDRAFVLWTDEPPPGQSGMTRVLLAHSAAGPRFHGTKTLASFSQPPGVRLTPGSVAAERLSSEGVALVWPAMRDGDYIVEAAGATQNGVLPVSTLSESGQDLRLGAVATGPANEIVVVVEVAPRTTSGFDQARQELLVTRSNEVPTPNGLGFGSLVPLAPAGPNSDPSVAVDPDDDTAVAAWQTNASSEPRVDYSISAGSG